jgi:hypothetical protein
VVRARSLGPLVKARAFGITPHGGIKIQTEPLPSAEGLGQAISQLPAAHRKDMSFGELPGTTKCTVFNLKEELQF